MKHVLKNKKKTGIILSVLSLLLAPAAFCTGAWRTVLAGTGSLGHGICRRGCGFVGKNKALPSLNNWHIRLQFPASCPCFLS